MFEPDFGRFFTAYQDPESGVSSYILTHRVAPVQLAFYFVSPSFSADARYLWFYCAFPPARGFTLGVIDFERQRLDHDPRTGFTAGPLVDDERPGVFWGTETAVWRRDAAVDAPIELVGQIPEEVVRGRHIGRCATHLTRSANGEAFLLDAMIGDEAVVGTLDVKGRYELWTTKRHRHHNHGQMSPTDPDLALLAWDYHTDPITGERSAYEDRLWLVRRGQALRPLLPAPGLASHEWWDGDGRHVWFVESPGPDLPRATYRADIETGEVERMAAWHWHAHDWNHGQYIVGDRRGKFYRGCPSSVNFVNRVSGKEVAVINHNPEHLSPGRQYHIDPHPRFSPCGRYIVHTTTVLGQPDVAVTPVVPLVDRTA